jgi:1-acyl-sn-glycerol-3-phosphate acyltransferase
MLMHRLVSILWWPAIWLVFRPRILGSEHLPKSQGFVVCPNHLSGFDAFAIAYALAPRPLRNMAKNQLFRRRLLGSVIARLGAFPAHDEPDLTGGVEAAKSFAARGDVVVIFPEGERRYGRFPRPRTGAARTALGADVPLVPAAIRGTNGWRRRARWQIAFGEPIELDDLRDLDPAQAAPEATQRLWEQVRDLEAVLGAPTAGRDLRQRECLS